MKLPNISICPPRGTYTNLNHDLMELDEKETEYEYEMKLNFAQYFQNIDFKQQIKNLKNGFQEKNQFLNWYKGNR